MILELSSLLFIIKQTLKLFSLPANPALLKPANSSSRDWWGLVTNGQLLRRQEAGGQVARCLLDPVLQCGSPVSPPHLLSCLHVCVTLLLPIYYIYYKLIFPNISDTITIFWEELSVILYYVTYSATLLTRLILHLWFSLHQTSIKVFLVHYFDDLTFVSFTVVEDCVTCFVEI